MKRYLSEICVTFLVVFVLAMGLGLIFVQALR